MKLFHIFSVSLLGALLVLSCESEENFQPGEPTSVTGSGVYFLSDYETQTIIGDEPTIEDTLWFELGRKDTQLAIDVPIVVETKNDCIQVPESVHFNAGDSTSWLGITYVGIAYGEDNKISLRIGDAYANPYAEKEGSTRLETSILRSQWVNVCDTLIFESSNKSWPNQGCYLQRLEGQKRLRFTNFLGSGQPFEFGLRSGWDNADLYMSKGEVNPLSNYYDSGTYWYFTNGGNYDPWTPAGGEKAISWTYFWVGAQYTFIDLQCDSSSASTYTWNGKEYLSDYYGHYSLLTGWFVYEDGTSGWDYIYLYLGYLK